MILLENKLAVYDTVTTVTQVIHLLIFQCVFPEDKNILTFYLLVLLFLICFLNPQMYYALPNPETVLHFLKNKTWIFLLSVGADQLPCGVELGRGI